MVGFDIATKSFTFATTDDRDPAPAMTCSATQCTATDHAGNTTILNFVQQTILSLKALKFTSIMYNGVSTAISNTAFAGRSDVTGYDEAILVGLREVMGVHYSQSKNQTTVVSYINNKLTKQVVLGKKFLQANTSNGTIKSVVLP